MNSSATIKAILAAIILPTCFLGHASAEPMLIDLDKNPSIASALTPNNYKYLFMQPFSDTKDGVSYTSHMKGTEIVLGDLMVVTGIKNIGNGPFVYFKIYSTCPPSSMITSGKLVVNNTLIKANIACFKEEEGATSLVFSAKTEKGLSHIVEALKKNDFISVKFTDYGVSTLINTEGFSKSWDESFSGI